MENAGSFHNAPYNQVEKMDNLAPKHSCVPRCLVSNKFIRFRATPGPFSPKANNLTPYCPLNCRSMFGPRMPDGLSRKPGVRWWAEYCWGAEAPLSLVKVDRGVALEWILETCRLAS